MAVNKKLPLWADLFLTFMKIGFFTFGGGYAMISVIEDICVEKKKWITHEEMMDITVIAESTPGPIAINCATYVGYLQGKIPGSIVATIGMVLPSFVVIYCISRFLNNFLEYAVIARAFRGIRIGVGLLIFRVGINMAKKMKKKALPMTILGCAFAAVLVIHGFGLDISTITLMLTAGFVSLCVFLCRKGGAKG